MRANRHGPIDATRQAWRRRCRDALFWVAGIGVAGGLMRLVVWRVTRAG